MKISNKRFSLDYLPPEVWTHILASLPAKTLLQLRCVCKSWCSIIDNPNFIPLHLQLCQVNSGRNRMFLALEGLGRYGHEGCLLKLRDLRTLEKINRIFRKSDLYSYHIIGSSNGLLLVNRKDGPCCYRLRLWNPSIRKSLLLPISPLPSKFISSSYLFGFAPLSKDYKVVAIAYDKTRDIEPSNLYFAVYTLSDQQWSVRKDWFDTSITPKTNAVVGPFHCLSTSVFIRGVAYWLGNNDGDGQRTGLTHLGSFDFDKEKFAFLELPFTKDDNSFSIRFLFLRGESVAVFNVSQVSCSMWVLQQDNKKEPWKLWWSGGSSFYEVFNFSGFERLKVLYCEGEGDGGYLVCGNHAYNIASRRLQEFRTSMKNDVALEMYSESLMLSKGYGACDLRVFP